jgi:hypothetical protein
MRRNFKSLLAAVPLAALLVTMFAMPASADVRDFTVVNNSSLVLTHVYVSSSDTALWGDDILGRDVLNPSETVDVVFGSFDGSVCLYDVKVTGQAGQEGILYKVDLCSVTYVTFSDAA